MEVALMSLASKPKRRPYRQSPDKSSAPLRFYAQTRASAYGFSICSLFKDALNQVVRLHKTHPGETTMSIKACAFGLSASLILALPCVAAPAVKAPVTKPVPVAPPPAVVYPPYGRSVTLAEAKTIVAAAEAEAIKNGWTMVITVVEPNGALVLSEKMDGAQYGSVGVAEKKAVTAANFRRPTLYFQEAVKNGTLNAIFTGAMALEGGELIIIDDRIVGAVGASGGSAPQDGVVARAGAAAVATVAPTPAAN
jgi:glc operon protein GlcG